MLFAFCGNSTESHEHLFFTCPYSAGVWTVLLQTNGVSCSPLSSMEEVEWAMQHSGGRKLQHTICKLSLAAVLYLLWIERNRRWFGSI